MSTPLYEYACRNWQEHVKSTISPSGQLVSLIRDFLVKSYFVYWSEALCIFPSQYDMGRQVEVRDVLRDWPGLLGSEKQIWIPLDDYCKEQYMALRDKVKAEASDRDPGALCLLRVMEYDNLTSSVSLPAAFWQIHLNDLVRDQGENDRLTLLAHRYRAIDMLVDCQPVSALEELNSLKRKYLAMTDQPNLGYFEL